MILLVAFYGLFMLVVLPGFAFQGSLWPWLLASLGLGTIRLFFLNLRDPIDSRGIQLHPMLSDRVQSRSQTLLLWRWHQMFRRNRMAKLCLAMSGILSIGFTGMLFLHWPFFLIILGVMLGSLGIACAVAFQLEEDIRAIWFERQIGCSHQEFVAVYQRLCYALGLAYGLSLFLILACSPQSLWQEGWKILPIAALFPCLLPSVMFQLAPDRPFLQILVTALIGLFLGTAIYAHGGATALVPVVIYYAKHYQEGNFYRS
jgi:hypothetical protein